jgi:hypothetical protein
VLVGHARQRIQAAAGTTCQNYTFHLSLYFPGAYSFETSCAGMADYCREQLESQLNYCAEHCRKIAARSEDKTQHFLRQSGPGTA